MIGTILAPKKTFPCYRCPNRKIGCHAKCEAYKKAVLVNEEVNKMARAQYIEITGKEPYYRTKQRCARRNRGYAGRERYNEDIV